VIALFCTALFTQSQLDYRVENRGGLKVAVQGIPIIVGSYFQYYAPGWSRGYYSSQFNDQKVTQVGADQYRVEFNSEVGANGTISYVRSGSSLSITYEFGWTKTDPALVEVNFGQLWLPPFKQGSAWVDGGQGKLFDVGPTGNELGARSLGKEGTETLLKGAALEVKLQTSRSSLTFDARNYSQDWAQKSPVYWQGVLSVPVEAGKISRLTATYDIAVKNRPDTSIKRVASKFIAINQAMRPESAPEVLIPKPKAAILDWADPIEICGKYEFPAGRPRIFERFEALIGEKFEKPRGTSGSLVQVDGGIADLRKRAGAYKITITRRGISFLGQDQEGVENALYRLSQLAFSEKGKIWLPTGVIEDEPASDFRAVHLFVGKNSLEFHKRLWTRVLRPLGFNKVVLQCERTAWDAAPGTDTDITMQKADLAKLFSWYRSIGVEPIPLIQSFGHMEWLLANGKYSDLALNPKLPYAINPENTAAKQKIQEIWAEAVALLKPKILHFGLDEVAMRGFLGDSRELTRLWKIHIPFLAKIAEENGCRMMLWGDEALAPSEAIDAANGVDVSTAADRRSVIPKSAIVADWHYRAEEKHTPFLKSLQTWRVEGIQRVASAWYRPENVRGFFRAAAIENSGVLQTTWAGYESSEDAMLRAPHQFDVMVLAADMGWSARDESISELDYNWSEVFGRMYSAEKSPIATTNGRTLGNGNPIVIGNVHYNRLSGLSTSGLTNETFLSPTQIVVPINETVAAVFVALTCENVLSPATPLGSIQVEYADGNIKQIPLGYRNHVVAETERSHAIFARTLRGISSLRIPVEAKEIKQIRLSTTNLSAGLELKGVTLIPLHLRL
jgi:hypothetical protein